jgi:hypothetical protein
MNSEDTGVICALYGMGNSLSRKLKSPTAVNLTIADLGWRII